MKDIPVVDLQSLKGGTESEKNIWMSVVKSFQSALRTRGVAYIINHGISEVLVEQAFDVSQKFFEQPNVMKEKYFFDPKKAYHGYNRRGVELHGRGNYDLRESFDCSGTNRFYPSEVPMFAVVLEELEYKSKELLKILLRLLAMSLEIEDELYFIKASKYLDNHSIANCSTFRTLFYPAIVQEVALPRGTVRTKEHTDFGIITLLFQDKVGGLEVKTIDGNWIPVVPQRDALLINTGDLLEFWTGGLIPATPHRVLIPNDENRRKMCRQSIAYFIQPDENFVIHPINCRMITYKETFDPITTLQYVTTKLKLVY